MTATSKKKPCRALVKEFVRLPQVHCVDIMEVNKKDSNMVQNEPERVEAASEVKVGSSSCALTVKAPNNTAIANSFFIGMFLYLNSFFVQKLHFPYMRLVYSSIYDILIKKSYIVNFTQFWNYHQPFHYISSFSFLKSQR